MMAKLISTRRVVWYCETPPEQSDDRHGAAQRRQRHFEVAAEFTNKIDRDARMYSSLLVVEYCRRTDWKHRRMPNLGVNVDAERPVAVEGDKVLGRHVVAGPGKQRHVRRTLARPKDLAAIRMIVRLMCIDTASVSRLGIL